MLVERNPNNHSNSVKGFEYVRIFHSVNAKKEYVQLSQAKIEKVTNYQASKGLIKDHGMILKKYLHTYLCNFLKKKQDNEAYCFSAQFYLHPNVAVFG